MAHVEPHRVLNQPVPFSLHVPESLLETTKEKLELARYPVELEDVDDWSHGSQVDDVRRLAKYWLEDYDWRLEEQKINSTFKQFRVLIDTHTHHGTQLIHYAHHPSKHAAAIPLLFVSGWPGSFLEARKLIQPLTSPEDPNTQQAFHLVVCSIPGFGPGDPPKKSGFGPVTVARAFKQVMVDVLGYDRFVTQGGDIGASITRLMALQYPQHVRACHHNFVPVRPPPLAVKHVWATVRFLCRDYFYTARELESVQSMLKWQEEEGAYSAIQRTKPQTLGFGMGDSPIGLLAWFLEKFHGWMDTKHYEMPDEEVLNFVMMHWIQGATPGFRMYKASRQEDIESVNTRNNAWTTYLPGTPWGVSFFPKEIARPPLEWVRAVGDLKWYKEHNKGGHFPSTECPDLLVEDLREWFGGELVKSAMTR